MKKLGILFFGVALVVGLVVTNMFSFGKINFSSLKFPLKFGAVHGSGQTAVDHRDVSGFHGVEAGGVFQLEIVAQKEFGVDVEADDNLLPMITTEVRGGILRISADKRFKTNNPIRVRVTAPDIDSLDISGAGSVNVSDIKNSGLEIESSGASKVRVSGSTAKLILDVSGATKVDAESLSSENATVEASGACSVTLSVSGTLRAEASGASRVLYSGSPKEVAKSASGASSVSAK